MHDRRQDRADRIAFHGRSSSALPTTASRRYGVSGPRSRPCETVSENPAIEGQGDCDQHGAAVVYCESAAVARCLVRDNSICAVHLSTSNGLGLTEDRLRLDRLPATAAANFFPPRAPRFASRSKKAV